MGKAEFMTPKAIANRIKAKGLQKLRWYCQMCQKQCRDENGFKCHMMSESHQRQMNLFQDSPGKFVGSYSEQFKSDFLRLLKHRFHTNRVFANVVYNEYIHDRHHVHMNATAWSSLSGFVQFLGRHGYCKVDETPKGWYIAYIDRDPEVLAKMEASKRKDQMALDDADRAERALREQIERGQAYERQIEELSEEEARRIFEEEHGGPAEAVGITLTLKPKLKTDLCETNEQKSSEETHSSPIAVVESDETPNSSDSAVPAASSPSQPIQSPEPVPPSTSPTSVAPVVNKSSDTPTSIAIPAVTSAATHKSNANEDKDKKRRRPHDVLESLMEEQESQKRQALHTKYSATIGQKKSDAWLTSGIVVKVMSKVSNGKYFKKKGVVQKVIDSYVGEVKMLDSDGLLRVDQEDMETVIPAIGGKVIILRGPYRGQEAELVTIDIDQFSCNVMMCRRELKGQIVKGVAYEDVSKLSAV
eukprot:c4773_g1_i1.p1 GENE.c4773_g1_i1~~c4773_g1_i1.p1  ORF type:complete len:485 (+),score=117.50 c4773_g1_i1:37-1455(+)